MKVLKQAPKTPEGFGILTPRVDREVLRLREGMCYRDGDAVRLVLGMTEDDARRAAVQLRTQNIEVLDQHGQWWGLFRASCGSPGCDCDAVAVPMYRGEQ